MRQLYKVAIVGATGLVGQTLIKEFERRDFPVASLTLFASQRSEGKKIEFKNEPILVQVLDKHSFDQGFDFVFFSAGASISLEYATIAASKGAKVIDNSSAFRMHDDHPLIVPEVNGHVMTSIDDIIANPNCSTIQSVVPLSIVHRLFGLKRVIFNTYQAVSGSGYHGIMDLESGLEGKHPSFYPKPISGNVIPQIDVFFPEGKTKEEWKMIEETKKILDLPDLKVSATCVRVPVMVGHSVSIQVECVKPIDLKRLNQAFNQDPSLIIYEDPAYPTPLDLGKNEQIHIGRIRKDDVFDNGLSMFVVADNVLKGAATNAIQIAEMMIEEAYL